MGSSFLRLSHDDNVPCSSLYYSATVSRNEFRFRNCGERECDANSPREKFNGFQRTAERERPRVRPGVEGVESHAQAIVLDTRGGTGEVRHVESEPGVH